MNKANGKRLLSALLLVALLLGLVPAFSLSALAVPADATVTTEEELIQKLNDPNVMIIDIDDGGSEFILTKEIKITRPVTLQGKNRKTGDNAASRATIVKAAGNFQGEQMFLIENATSVTFVGLTLDINNPKVPEEKQPSRRAITVVDGKLQLGDSMKSNDIHHFPMTIQNGYSSGNHGGAINASGATVVARKVSFIGNEAEATNGTGGGAVYLNTSDGVFTECTFNQNKAHSGGAIYFFGGENTNCALYVDQCQFGTGVDQNSADQRGGAIHCHGLAIVNNTTIQGQKSDQYKT